MFFCIESAHMNNTPLEGKGLQPLVSATSYTGIEFFLKSIIFIELISVTGGKKSQLAIESVLTCRP